jgi:NADPH-dependent 2,4-dienoyl-CoA reductase/sulfur reductase-like enzyme
MKTELAVIGAGPAGLCTAIEAARHGVDVTLIDENRTAGGQLFKQIHRFFGSEEHLAGVRGIEIGDMLLEDAKTYNVRVMLNTVVWGLFTDRKIGISDGDRVDIVEPEKIVVATGASENSLSFPGWTLPNIMGAGAAQTMINVNRVLPGQKVIIVGSGNVGLIVAYQLLQAGADVLAVIEALPQVSGYGVHANKIVRMGVPILTEHTILSAEGETCVTGAEIARVDEKFNAVKGSEFKVDVDLVCIAVGLRPLAELCWMAGMAFDYQPELGGFVPLHNELMESSMAGVYVAGDVAGIEEASSAMEEGKLAGTAAGISLGKIDKIEGEKYLSVAGERLRALRLGPFGDDRYESKEKIIKKYHTA